jgi:hypothetical protein
MNEGAGVHALDALTDWHAALAAFRSAADNGLTSMALALQRNFDWLAEQQQHWRREIRAAEDAVVQAKNDLRKKQYEDWLGKKPDTTVEEKNLRRTQERLHRAEDQLATTRGWQMRLPGLIQDTYEGPVRNLSFFVEIDLRNALAQLARQLGILEEYVNLQPNTVTPPAPAAALTSPSPPSDGGEGGVRGPKPGEQP